MEYLGKLKEMTKTQIENSVHFVGNIPYSEMGKFLKSAHIYVSTSLSDGSSTSLMEAMACGLAVVVTGIQGNMEWVIDGRNGFLFPPKDHSALAKKVLKLSITLRKPI